MLHSVYLVKAKYTGTVKDLQTILTHKHISAIFYTHTHTHTH